LVKSRNEAGVVLLWVKESRGYKPCSAAEIKLDSDR